MCEISLETLRRANDVVSEVLRNSIDDAGTISSEGITVSVSVYGKVYKQTITEKEIRENYKKALEDWYGKKI